MATLPNTGSARAFFLLKGSCFSPQSPHACSQITKKYIFNQLDLQPPIRVAEFLSICTPKLLSKIYKLLCKIDDTISLPTSKCEADLSISSNHNFWPQIYLNTFRMTENLNLQFIQYRILHRTHYTGQKMFRMGLKHSSICLHYTQTPAYIAQITHLMIIHTLRGFVGLYRSSGLRFVRTCQHGSTVIFFHLYI